MFIVLLNIWYYSNELLFDIFWYYCILQNFYSISPYLEMNFFGVQHFCIEYVRIKLYYISKSSIANFKAVYIFK